MSEIHSEIKGVINQVRYQMNDYNEEQEQRDKQESDILLFFRTLIHDPALIR